MRVPTFLLERNQTLYENTVEINLTESGVHPATIADLMDEEACKALHRLPLGYGYTDGRPSLRSAIADWHPGATSKNVLVANGTSEANLLALMSLTEPGDHIVVVVPNFMQLDGLAQGLGVAVSRVALDAADDWQPNIARIDAAITDRTKLVTLCDPNNPTGVAMTAESRRALAELTHRRRVTLHVDEIYRGSEIDGGASPTAWGLGDHVVVTGGLAKSFGLPGLRIGWLVGPPSLVAACHARQDYTTIGTGPLAQVLAEAALTEPVRTRLLSRGRAILSRGREAVATWLRAHNGWSWVRPAASGMAFLSYELDMPSETFVEALRRETGVFVCAGSWFGMDGHVRLGFGVDEHHLIEGLSRLDAFLARHS